MIALKIMGMLVNQETDFCFVRYYNDCSSSYAFLMFLLATYCSLYYHHKLLLLGAQDILLCEAVDKKVSLC